MGEHEPDPDLPPTLRRLWGQEDRPRRGPKPALSVDAIVRAAAAIADAEGLSAVSMARIGDALGYSAMALYRHVESKDELLVQLADHVAADLTMPAHAGDWRSGLHAWTLAQIEAVLARPWFLDLPLATVQPGPHRMRWLNEAFGVLREVDLPAAEKMAVIGLLAQHVLAEGRVQVEAGRAAADGARRARGLPADAPVAELTAAELAAANPLNDFETVLQHLADPADYPHLTEALSGDSATFLASDPETDVDFGLTIVLDGVQAYLLRRTAG
ncbi:MULTISPECIES: TetR/AcrR family transcriptional regulator [Pseudonocardia]|uniref:Bacterial regulatory protein n=2 Tax=Pseudonocardia TaxID=1847 RepID=A0A1Y2MWX0_PSEAH|nr:MULTISPECIES: TetR/AcrR family transcriptional regulator [Pseudonocardia]OSY39694.1 Bacterial regulatory protein [Pseudonocardia autotrophica]TDN72824.1 TetR family transcriptional regulator [Pseudonocardia autotrophica]BBG03542.1 TetR family transcriptional regulator [Pseudonocardia autotrophica]GEC24962.1 TetR family transcriptional regulator [Pseudonocardia saturnea]